jgi:type II secretory pathway pseudopilin PulG
MKTNLDIELIPSGTGPVGRIEHVCAGLRCRPAALLLHSGFRFGNGSDMKSSCPPNHFRQTANSARAFTLTELAVVIATIAVLTALVLPALAGVANKGGRAQCANNLRQIYVASMIYATEYRDWLPIDDTHPQSINVLNALIYTRYVVSGSANIFVPTNSGFIFNNLGFVYHAGLVGNGGIFYCPEQWGTYLGANYYLPLLTTDSSGTVRSSYAFNPRTVDPANGNYLRLFQKTSDLPPHKLFVVDYLGSSGTSSSQNVVHFRERGWNVLFTDGSVQFSRNVQAYNLIQITPFDESAVSHMNENQIFNLLELDH